MGSEMCIRDRLNFSDRTRTGVFSVIWPLAKEDDKNGLFEFDTMFLTIIWLKMLSFAGFAAIRNARYNFRRDFVETL